MVGLVSVTKFATKTVLVLLQTFILSGASVRQLLTRGTWKIDCVHSCVNTRQRAVQSHGQVCFRVYLADDTFNFSFSVVTGATDGIGKEFALQLAKAGFNILLVSRSEEKLKATAEEIGAPQASPPL